MASWRPFKAGRALELNPRQLCEPLPCPLYTMGPVECGRRMRSLLIWAWIACHWPICESLHWQLLQGEPAPRPSWRRTPGGLGRHDERQLCESLYWLYTISLLLSRVVWGMSERKISEPLHYNSHLFSIPLVHFTVAGREHSTEW